MDKKTYKTVKMQLLFCTQDDVLTGSPEVELDIRWDADSWNENLKDLFE